MCQDILLTISKILVEWYDKRFYNKIIKTLKSCNFCQNQSVIVY